MSTVIVTSPIDTICDVYWNSHITHPHYYVYRRTEVSHNPRENATGGCSIFPIGKMLSLVVCGNFAIWRILFLKEQTDQAVVSCCLPNLNCQIRQMVGLPQTCSIFPIGKMLHLSIFPQQLGPSVYVFWLN